VLYKTEQLSLLTELHPNVEDWTFNGASTRELTHCYHDYPARMIPQIASKLLDMFAAVDATLLFDPYCGTGTSLVEGFIRGLNVIGTDLNPLARLIAKAKLTLPDSGELDKEISRFNRFILNTNVPQLTVLPRISGITRLDFWFKPSVIEKLQHLKSFINRIEEQDVRLFFQVAFSETVRDSSNTRHEEFKLYRYDETRLKKFNPDVFAIMAMKLKRNRSGLIQFKDRIENFKRLPKTAIYDFNTVNEIPHDKVQPNSVDIVVTSPPYGDSHTTVAYGQYSRLSAAWLDLEEADKIDNKLMGGKTYKKIPEFPCDVLNDALNHINKIDRKRAFEVSAFYSDLLSSISHVADVIKPGGFACYVVGNRKVKGITLPTDITIRDFFEEFNFDYIDTFHRSIPNKRMPLRNSPTNVAGSLGTTMIQEYIVVMRKRIPKALMEKRIKYSAKRKGR